jgi:hypothetical protein
MSSSKKSILPVKRKTETLRQYGKRIITQLIKEACK